MTDDFDIEDIPEEPAAPAAENQKRGAKAREVLSTRLIRRLLEPALNTTYTAGWARRRKYPERMTVADALVEMVLAQAFKCDKTLLRTLWERAEGAVPPAQAVEESAPRCVRTPLPIQPNQEDQEESPCS